MDESGTHDEKWLVIGALFVPDHGPLHSALCKVKEDIQYFNQSTKRSSRYKETHLADFRSPRDVKVGRAWVDEFVASNCFYRAVIVDWSIWDGSHHGQWWEKDSLKKRRAYKKWAEMLLSPEVSEGKVRSADLLLDRLKAIGNYDVLEHLKERFATKNIGGLQCIQKYQHTDSWMDAHQCLQLCDLLTGCLYQHLVPASSPEKTEMRMYLQTALAPLNVKHMGASFWKGFTGTSLRRHLPRYSAWFWKPTE